ncbi:acyltransferase family protein, partial [Pseudomonas sp. NMI795_08]|uniref:acyltransferase family protein n=1 Tax=Pseudomonas sp. NMI795_08 TaxID=2903144 RepID=UPI003FA6E113|nr:hypothetical protein [Pseudomonas sp. NMI795_08]
RPYIRLLLPTRQHGYLLSSGRRPYKTFPKLSTVAWTSIEVFTVGLLVFTLNLVASPSIVNDIAGAGAAYYTYKEGIWLLWGAMILVFALSRGLVARLLTLRPLVYLGEISFALYLVHAIIINLADRHAETIQAAGVLGVALFWLVCLLSSAALHTAVENPLRKIIINAWDRKEPSSRTSHFKAPQLASILLLLCGSLFAANYQPSTIDPIDLKDVPTSRISKNHFDNGISLISASKTLNSNGEPFVNLYFTLIKPSPLNRHIGVHINDEHGNIISVIGDIVIDQSSISHPQGLVWVNSIKINESDFNKAKSIGIATFQDVNALDSVVAGTSDWNGKRLIVNLPL